MKLFQPLIQFQKWINKQTCSSDYRIYKFQLLYLQREDNSFSILKDRIKTILRIIKMPLYIRLEKVKTLNIVYGYPANKYKIKNDIKRYDKKEELFFLSSHIGEPIYIYSSIDFFRFVKYYLLSIKDSILLAFIFNKLSTKELSYFLYIKVRLFVYRPEKLYIHSPRSPESNLAFLFFSNCMGGKVDLIIGPHIKTTQRYGYYENVRLCFITKISKEEYGSLERIGWIKSKNVDKLTIGTAQKKLQKKYYSNISSVDVGFFSSGEWARYDTGLRCYKEDEIKRNKENYCKNKNAKIEMIILRNLISLAKKYNFILKVYLHPYEKELIERFNIYPPYWNSSINEQVIIDKDISTNNDIFEAKIGVVLMSTIFYDRWGNDLYTLCFSPKNKKSLLHIKLKYLGKYSNYGFQNIKELEEKILNQLEKKE